MQHNKTCVVLGGSGFVGRRLINQLCDAGYSVRVPTRNRETSRSLLVIPRVKVVTADIHDADRLHEVIAGADVVINLVGILNERGHHRGRGFYVAHQELTESIIAACIAQGVPRLLQMSALKADPKGPSDYLKSKGLAEQALRKVDTGQLAWTIFQPSVIFGPADSFMNRFAGLLKIAPVMPLAKPNARFAPVYVGDVVAGFMRALRDDATIGKRYQMCGPRVYSLRELVRYVAEQLQLKRWIVGLPDPVAKLQARIFDFVPGKPLSTDNLRSLSVHSICDANGLAALGITPTPMEAIVPGYLTSD
ncbi:MAG: complex I NDUFA9 subunit family protein [Pseudomonadota bacterium]